MTIHREDFLIDSLHRGIARKAHTVQFGSGRLQLFFYEHAIEPWLFGNLRCNRRQAIVMEHADDKIGVSLCCRDEL